MIQSLRQIKRRIRSIENTEKLTHAMELIAVAKLRPLQERLGFRTEYFSKVNEMLQHFLASFSNVDHPFLKEREPKRKISLCVLTSDTGLCGSHNYDIIRAAEKFISEQKGIEIRLVTVGKKGYIHFKKKGLKITDACIETHGHYSQGESDKLSQRLIDLFLGGEADEVHVAYTRFVSASRRRPTIEKILNLSVPATTDLTQYLIEPDIGTLVNDFIPFYILSKMRFIMLNALVCEHSARGMAMEEATDNAEEMLEELILSRNKVRQANITREIIEIISSADALKG